MNKNIKNGKLLIKEEINEELYLAINFLRLIDNFKVDSRYKNFVYDVIADMETELFANFHKKYGFDIVDSWLEMVEILEINPFKDRIRDKN